MPERRAVLHWPQRMARSLTCGGAVTWSDVLDLGVMLGVKLAVRLGANWGVAVGTV